MHAYINGHHLHYVDEGPRDAPPVVFVHGFPLDLELWRGQMQACTTSFRTVAYDVMGHGSSDVGDGQYSIEGHVNDLAGIMDHLGIAQAAVAGLSMGGYITLRALERIPQRILAAVLCDTRSGADSTEGKLKRFAGMEQVKKEGSRAFADGFVRALFAPGSFQRVPAAVERIHSVISHTPPLSIAGTLLALAARTDTTPSLRVRQGPHADRRGCGGYTDPALGIRSDAPADPRIDPDDHPGRRAPQQPRERTGHSTRPCSPSSDALCSRRTRSRRGAAAFLFS